MSNSVFMTTLLFPGRHILNTRFQERYLDQVLGRSCADLPDLLGAPPDGQIDEIVFAVTSCNKSNSRYNPLPFEIRSILVYEFARPFKQKYGVDFRVLGIPHYRPTESFATLLLKEIAAQTDDVLTLTPKNTIVLSSTALVIAAYQQMGFAVLPAEYDPTERRYFETVPTEVVQALGEGEMPLETLPLSASSLDVFRSFPDAVSRVQTLFHDPLLTEQGDLTETRDYTSYARAMSSAIEFKYQDIREFLLAGKIVDEGCADGALIERIVKDFPDSDLIGVDLSSEMLARANELKRAGAFGHAFVFFKQQNLTSPVSDTQANRFDTVICNSTLHELWSYGNKAATVRAYLRDKTRQLRRGGRLVIRDVVGPDDGDAPVYLWCRDDDGLNPSDPSVCAADTLSTRALFIKFAQEFPLRPIDYGWRDELVALSLRDAMEFVLKREYTDNWHSEMQEEFCFWSFADWTRELTEAGLTVLSGSHAYVNQWRVENQFHPKLHLFDETLDPRDFSVTNMILVGEKCV